MMPCHFGHWRTVNGWFRELAQRFLFQTIHDVEVMLDRQRQARGVPDGCGDRQPVDQGSACSRPGHDAVTIVGRKRPIAGDTDGRLRMVQLTPADSSDSANAKPFSTLFADAGRG